MENTLHFPWTDEKGNNGENYYRVWIKDATEETNSQQHFCIICYHIIKNCVRTVKVNKWLGSQKKVGTFNAVEKDSLNTRKLCNKEFSALMTQNTTNNNPQS
jgi:hypothetical protein